MTARDRKLLAALVPVLLIGALWLLVISPKRSELAQLDDEVAAARSELVAAQSRLSSYEAARDQLAANLVAIERAGRAVPSTMAIPSLLRQLERAAIRSNVDLTIVSQGGDAPKSADEAAEPTDPMPSADAVSAVDLALTFEGGFFAVQRYFAHLERFVEISQRDVDATGRLLAISNIKLGPAEEDFPTVNVNVDANVYTLPDLNAVLPVPVSADAAPAGPAPPATTASIDPDTGELAP